MNTTDQTETSISLLFVATFGLALFLHTRSIMETHLALVMTMQVSCTTQTELSQSMDGKKRCNQSLQIYRLVEQMNSAHSIYSKLTNSTVVVSEFSCRKFVLLEDFMVVYISISYSRIIYILIHILYYIYICIYTFHTRSLPTDSTHHCCSSSLQY